ncbi:hypothetical protein BC938DRAFT_478690 [Jimgerdemannia flammicorona]|uniref:RPA43 OB domain-containing protein n=1 Tax=Jimgerdemannia flammicorona TaxID=994334 RepID=A0A433QY80_9FUNG|nr:hypothetical protein BC938DRAFT_478690 [Jimgerdemannia flammicorona]
MAAEHKERPSKKRKHPEDSDAATKKKHKKQSTASQGDGSASTAVVSSQKDTASSPFNQVRARIYIHLAPLWVGQAADGVNEQLNAFLMRYVLLRCTEASAPKLCFWVSFFISVLTILYQWNLGTHRYVPQFDGVVLAHSNLKIMQPNARIMYDSPYCHFWIAVDLLVWKPVKGSKLGECSNALMVAGACIAVGTINLQSADHIGLLLYGTFNASIPREFIPTAHYEWRPSSFPGTPAEEPAAPNAEGAEGEDQGFNKQRTQNGEWVIKKTGESVGATDGVVIFTVVDLVQANDMLTVTGALLPPTSSSSMNDTVNQVGGDENGNGHQSMEKQREDKKAKNGKDKKRRRDEADDTVEDKGSLVEAKNNEAKKKKRDKEKN